MHQVSTWKNPASEKPSESILNTSRMQSPFSCQSRLTNASNEFGIGSQKPKATASELSKSGWPEKLQAPPRVRPSPVPCRASYRYVMKPHHKLAETRTPSGGSLTLHEHDGS